MLRLKILWICDLLSAMFSWGSFVKTMEPKREHSEHQDGDTRIERTTYDDPDTKTHTEEVRIEKSEKENGRKDEERH
jgi:hypothetical protein